jgi:uncharacterized protein with GYD domain
MPKYLFQVHITQEGIKGTLKEGGTARKAAIVKLIEAIGGKVEAFYYAFGQTDLFIIADNPDNAAAAAGAMISEAAGAAEISVTVLISPEEIDQAAQMAQKVSASYRPPGR